MPHTHKFDKLITTGSALQSDVSLIPGNVSVVDSQTISTMPNTKIADVVKKLAGVRIHDDFSFNPRPQIKIRGINYGTLVMLDGVILSDLEGEARILNQISLYDVKRVEVARGSFASLYGTNAMGGVINFITDMPQDFEAQAIMGYGHELSKNTGDNTFRFYGSVGDVFFDKKLKIKLSAGYTSSDIEAGFPTYLANNAVNTAALAGMSGYYVDKAGKYILGTGGRRQLEIYDIRFKARLDMGERDSVETMVSFSNHNNTFGKWRSFLSDANGNATHLVNGRDYFVGSGFGGIGSYSHLLGNLTYTHAYDNAFLKVALSSVNLFSTWQDANVASGADRNGGAGTTQDINSSSNYLDIIYQNTYFSNHTISAATQFRYYKLTQKQRNMTNWLINSSRGDTYRSFGSEAFVASGYVNVDSQWTSSISSTLGLRYDLWQNFNGYFYNQANTTQNSDNQSNSLSIFSPKLGINYNPSLNDAQNLIFKASIGTGFRMPTMRDKYFTPAGMIWSISPSLKHERAISFDVGAEYALDSQTLNGVLNTSLYYFHIELDDMIYRAGNGSAANPTRYMNAGKGRILGVEYAFSLPLFVHRLSLDGNYTLTHATIVDNPINPATEGKQLATIPRHTANLSLNYAPRITQNAKGGGIYGSLWAFYVAPFYVDDLNTTPLKNTFGYYEEQFSLNAKVGYAFNNGLDVSLSAYNITNNRYYDYYQVSGTSLYAQLGYKY
ncbi:TonB-dependent receptor [Helicobacter jaachi]|uniref:TonB-dependent receptor n=1 Tax=Helicobacter jaachi TaxID=1677920 RepID=A0A4U8TBB4_9HELI|nr:TonB-dependent receptor [Helicobacter jaachi]TLD97210.1 TonB-dependent receptor [Helicobacter jaachi]